jgi:hypothetical protein
MFELLCNIGVGVDLFESLILLEAKKLAELVQRAAVPRSRLLDPQHRNGFQVLWDIASAKSTYSELVNATQHRRKFTCNLFNTGDHDLCQLAIFEFAICSSLEPCERAFLWIF